MPPSDPEQSHPPPVERGHVPSRSDAHGESRGGQLPHRHRVVVWSLIVLASILLVVSITANWVQREALDTNEVVATTDEILKDEDVQEALSLYTVEQLYANVDVQGEIEARLPGPARALAAPVAAATRQLALDVEQRALASPQVQELVTRAVGVAHGQFISLIRDEGEYVSTTGGEVTLQYGSVVADLAARLGVDPATISEIQDLIQGFSQDLRDRLTTASSEIAAARAELPQAQEGELSPELQQRLETLRTRTFELQGAIAPLQKAVKDAQGKVPAQVQDRLQTVDDLLSDLDDRLTTLERRTRAVLESPRPRNAETLDAALASLQGPIDGLLERQIVQTPGELVLMSSSQLGGVQALVQTLRNLGFVLPLLVLLLYLGAIYLARGRRREALIAAGGGILAATLLVLLARRLIGNAVVDSLAGSATVEPAIRSVWDIISGGLRERALFILVIGLGFVGGGVLAGPGRAAIAIRRWLAPSLRDRPVVVYAVVAALFLLWLTFLPGIENLGQVLVIAGLAVLAVVGIEVLRRQTAREFPSLANEERR